MKTGVIDVGGGLRGIYAAGILDRLLEEGISFDTAIGISAGSANLASFLAGQKGRTFRFYTEYSQRPEYMGIGNVRSKGCFLDLDYVYGTLSFSGGEDPFDYPAFRASRTDFYAVATDAADGSPAYFSKADVRQDDYGVFKASSALPFFCAPQVVNEKTYFDGALSDPVPVRKMRDLGCDRILLLLTRPLLPEREPGKDLSLAEKIETDYPNAAAAYRRRAETYNRSVAFARELEREGTVLIIAPDETCGVDTLSGDPAGMRAFYEKGMRDAERAVRFLGQSARSS